MISGILSALFIAVCSRLLADIGQDSAVHVQNMAVDKIGGGGGQEHRRTAQVGGLAPTVGGGFRQDELVEGVLGAVGLHLAQRRGLRRGDIAGADAVALDVIPLRNASNRRRYSEKDIAWIAFIKRLKATGMPIKEIKKYAALRAKGDVTLSERMEMLIQHRQSLNEQIMGGGGVRSLCGGIEARIRSRPCFPTANSEYRAYGRPARTS